MIFKNIKIEDVVISNEKIDNKGFIKDFSELYLLKKQISVGPKGNNYKVEDLKRNSEMRIVKMMKKANKINSLTLTESSIEKLLNLNHMNLGCIYDIIEDEKFVYLVQDYYSQGDLFNFILIYKNILDEGLIKIIIRQILCGIKQLHDNNVIHRGIKAQNIFIVKFDEKDFKQTLVKVCDFGSAAYFRDCLPLNDFCDNPFYSSPELIKGSYDNKSDLWSVGIIAYFLLTGEYPYKGKEYDVLFRVFLRFLNSKIIFFV